ncbi:MAG: P-loop NTPase, partial [Deltaproteobacteria bacterium]|nr:P-loop NTPase [Deltaproteobacteria bacterium]
MVDIQDSMPPDPKKIEEQKDAAVKSALQKIKHKIIVMSGKGGVGKTSTAVNLSLALADAGNKVGIM